MKFALLAGHSGTTWGHYWTPGKRGPLFYEGVVNREICEKVVKLRPDVEFLNPGPMPLTLGFKADFVNKLHKKFPDLVLLSVHANADGNGKKWTKANGTTVFTSKRCSTTSTKFAKILSDRMAAHTTLKSRGVKQVNFKILRGVTCPSVMVETGFMTNRGDAVDIESHHGQVAITDSICRAMFDLELSR
jgi:N-acetylmuramoyl-L-alanine amidase